MNLSSHVCVVGAVHGAVSLSRAVCVCCVFVLGGNKKGALKKREVYSVLLCAPLLKQEHYLFF